MAYTPVPKPPSTLSDQPTAVQIYHIVDDTVCGCIKYAREIHMISMHTSGAPHGSFAYPVARSDKCHGMSKSCDGSMGSMDVSEITHTPRHTRIAYFVSSQLSIFQYIRIQILLFCDTCILF